MTGALLLEKKPNGLPNQEKKTIKIQMFKNQTETFEWSSSITAIHFDCHQHFVLFNQSFNWERIRNINRIDISE